MAPGAPRSQQTDEADGKAGTEGLQIQKLPLRTWRYTGEGDGGWDVLPPIQPSLLSRPPEKNRGWTEGKPTKPGHVLLGLCPA